jgi:hypothetical protein
MDGPQTRNTFSRPVDPGQASRVRESDLVRLRRETRLLITQARAAVARFHQAQDRVRVTVATLASELEDAQRRAAELCTRPHARLPEYGEGERAR